MTTQSYIGRPQDRVDGPEKVSGRAKYAGEFSNKDVKYGFVLSSAIAKGWITSMDIDRAERVPGVIKAYYHEVKKGPEPAQDDTAPSGKPFRPLASSRILFSGQPIALVVAYSPEAAREAAYLIDVQYGVEKAETDLEHQRDKAQDAKKGLLIFRKPPAPRGDADEAFENAEIKISAEYKTPMEFHNPMEMHAATVFYELDGSLVVFDKTQGVMNSQSYICETFKLPKRKVQVLSPYVGGAFGSGLRPQYQLYLAVMASLDLKTAVRVTMTRPQMFTFGHRPQTLQRLRLSADTDGQLQSIEHETIGETSKYEDFTESVVDWSSVLYQCDNVRLGYQLVRLDVPTPMDMRAPGAASGMFALESAMDELAVALGMDPLELRLKNYAEQDQNHKRPFSSKELLACYKQGAEAFGWSRRNPAVRSMQDDHQLIGLGMATGCWEAFQSKASAKAKIRVDGRLTISSATSDIGTGTYTIMTQIAADVLGLPMDKVEVQLGDSSLPPAPLQGGSKTAATVGSAVKEVCEALAKKLFKIGKGLKHSPFEKAQFEDVVFKDAAMYLRKDPVKQLALSAVLITLENGELETEVSSSPNLVKQVPYSMYTHSAVFAEVAVDEDFGIVRVRRVTVAVAAGRIINPKTARSQIIGGVVWGIGQALQEEARMDHRFGRIMNHDLAGYHFPVHADMPEIEVIFVPEEDKIVNPLGVKGVGEIGIVGTAAAIANAIYHATGQRMRELPITLDKVLQE